MENVNVDVITPHDNTSAVTSGINGPPSFPPPPLPTEELTPVMGLNSTSEAFTDSKDNTHELDKEEKKGENDSSALLYNNRSILSTNSVIDSGLR